MAQLTATEEASLDRAKNSYLYNSADGPLSESTVNLLLVSPLLVTNGDGFLFVKLVRQPRFIYALSDDFSLFTQSRNELYDVLRIVKRLSEAALS